MSIFSLSKTYLIKHRPFYAAVISDCVVNLDWTKNPVDSAILNGRINLFINEKYLIDKEVPPKELALVIEQEINCLLNKHQIRSANHDKGRYIQAAHIATAQLGFQNRTPEWSKRMNYQEAKDSYGFGDKSQDLPAEIYYDKIPENPDGEGYGKPNGNGDSDSKGEGESEIEHGAAWSKTNTNEEQVDSILRDVVGDAVKKSRGNIPEHMKSLIDKILKPSEIPWEEQLKDFFQSKISINQESSWKRRNRNYSGCQFIMKGKAPTFTSLFVIFIDTSGSVSDKNLQDFLSEMSALHATSMHKIVTVCIDANFNSINEYDGESKFEFNGRGGTNFDPVIRLLNGDTSVLSSSLEEKWDELIGDNEIDGAVYFTDGECYLTNKNCKVPLIWVITSDGTKPEGFPGKVIQIKSKS